MLLRGCSTWVRPCLPPFLHPPPLIWAAPSTCLLQHPPSSSALGWIHWDHSGSYVLQKALPDTPAPPQDYLHTPLSSLSSVPYPCWGYYLLLHLAPTGMYTLWGGDSVIIVFVAPAPGPSAVPPKPQELPSAKEPEHPPSVFFTQVWVIRSQRGWPRNLHSIGNHRLPSQASEPKWVMTGNARLAGGGAQGLAVIRAQTRQAGGLGLGRRMRTVVMTTPARRPRSEKEHVGQREGGRLRRAPVLPSRSHYDP